jgi:succinate dehydrogenase / fumarate reductase, membrane anchor subunit
MVKSVTNSAQRGTRDWIIQRLSAIFIAVYTVVGLAYLICHPGLNYAQWHRLFSCNAIKVATLIVLGLMLYHAWIGIWTVFTDYIKCPIARATLNTLVLLTLFASFFWGLLIVGSV